MERNDWKERFRAIYRPLIGSAYPEFEDALCGVKSKHIRLNQIRGADYLSEVQELCAIEPLSGFKGVYKVLSSSDKLTDTMTFQTGGGYIMNPSSVLPAEILASYMPENPIMLDVSAAPGGKTCAISEFIGRKGLIIANEVSSSRLKSLHYNLEKYGCYNVKTVSMDGRFLKNLMPDTFDGILLDAPCSNEFKIFRDKVVQNQWSSDLIERMAALQRQLILSAFDCLRAGGVLVYSTCTLSVEENELTIKHLLDNRVDAEILKVEGGFGHGLSGISEIDGAVARVAPTIDSIDGFFTGIIRRKGETTPDEIRQAKFTDKQRKFFTDNFIEPTSDIFIKEAENRGYAETMPYALSDIRFQRRGLNLYRIAGDNLELSAQALWEFGRLVRDDLKTQITRQEALKYLKGQDIEMTGNYKGNLLFYNDIPIGPVKKIDGALKNKLDRYFLYGKNL